MKKIFYSMLAAGMLFATSCSQEDIVDVTKGEGQQVTIKVELPASESRAIAQGINVGEGNMVDKLVYAMYEEDQRTGEPLVTNFADRQADGTFKINVTMAKNIKYDLLFLAYNEENPAFVINSQEAKANNLNELKLRTDLKANKESYDAFVGMLDSHGIQDENVVTLTRPFAQINAVTTADDLAAVKGLKSEVTTSKLVIKAPDTYNVFTGEATNSVELTYDASAIIQDYTLANGADAYPKNEKFNSEYYYLTLAYVLAGETPNAPASTHNAVFEFYRQDNKMVSKLDIASLPLQRNFRTNVMGDLLTKSEGYTITVDAGFGEKDIVVDETGAMVVANETALKDVIANAGEGTIIKLGDDITLTEALTLPAGITFNGNGKQINGSVVAGGNLTFAGHTKVTSFSASYYDRTITIGEGACLEVTGTGRATLGYGNTFEIKGAVTDAKAADKEDIQPSLIIPGGISITGGNNAVMNIKDAYVQIGSTTSKNSAANGIFTLNIENSIADFTNQLTLAEPTGGMNPTFNINVKNSVLTTDTKFIVAAPNSSVVIDNSTVTLGTYFRNSGTMELKNGSVLTGSTIQFGENGGNDGTTTVDNSTLTINATSTGHALDGKGTGKIVLKNNAVANIDYYKDLTIEKDGTSTITGTKVD